MIKTFKHKGLERFFTTGSKKGIQPAHAPKLAKQLGALDQAEKAGDVGIVGGWKLHALQGEDAGRWSIWVSGNWRLTFEFVEPNAFLVDYEDYHKGGN